MVRRSVPGASANRTGAVCWAQAGRHRLVVDDSSICVVYGNLRGEVVRSHLEWVKGCSVTRRHDRNEQEDAEGATQWKQAHMT